MRSVASRAGPSFLHGFGVNLNAHDLERRGRVALVLTGLAGLLPLANYLSHYTPDAAARHCAAENAAVVAQLRPVVAKFGRDDDFHHAALAAELCESCAITSPAPIPLTPAPASNR